MFASFFILAFTLLKSASTLSLSPNGIIGNSSISMDFSSVEPTMVLSDELRYLAVTRIQPGTLKLIITFGYIPINIAKDSPPKILFRGDGIADLESYDYAFTLHTAPRIAGDSDNTPLSYVIQFNDEAPHYHSLYCSIWGGLEVGSTLRSGTGSDFSKVNITGFTVASIFCDATDFTGGLQYNQCNSPTYHAIVDRDDQHIPQHEFKINKSAKNTLLTSFVVSRGVETLEVTITVDEKDMLSNNATFYLNFGGVGKINTDMVAFLDKKNMDHTFLVHRPYPGHWSLLSVFDTGKRASGEYIHACGTTSNCTFVFHAHENYCPSGSIGVDYNCTTRVQPLSFLTSGVLQSDYLVSPSVVGVQRFPSAPGEQDAKVFSVIVPDNLAGAVLVFRLGSTNYNGTQEIGNILVFARYYSPPSIDHNLVDLRLNASNAIPDLEGVLRWEVKFPLAAPLYFLVTLNTTIDVKYPNKSSDEYPTFALDVSFTPYSCQNGNGGSVYSANGFIYGSCNCGYRFFGQQCDKVHYGMAEYVFQVLCLTMSNVAMLPGVLYSYKVKYRHLTALFAFSFIASILYHLCDTQVYCFSMSFQSLQAADFYGAFLSIAVVMCYLGNYPKDTLTLIQYILGFIIFIPIVNNPTDSMSVILILALSGVLFASRIIYMIHLKSKRYRGAIFSFRYLYAFFFKIKSFNLKYILMAILSVTVGGMSWVLETGRNYPYVHSLWHVGMMLSTYCFMKARREGQYDYDSIPLVCEEAKGGLLEESSAGSPAKKYRLIMGGDDGGEKDNISSDKSHTSTTDL